MSKSKILFLMSGSIAAFKAAQVLSRLVQQGHEVKVAMTPSTLNFIGPSTIEGLTGHPPLSDLWQAGQAMEHIDLTRWADFAVLCPASANSVARLSHGLADDIVSALALAWPNEKPFFIFPAMNTQMLASEATQENLQRLTRRGFRVQETGAGSLACGEVGEGRLLEPDEILKRLEPRARGSVLITSGATREPIDGIRYISNVSTGWTGARLADLLSAQGFQVTALVGEGAVQPTGAETISFSSFRDLDEKLREQLGRKDFLSVIHCAAVSDFSVESLIEANSNVSADGNDSLRKKISSGGELAQKKISSGGEITLQLKPNFKILPRLKEYSRRKDIKVIGFKLTLNDEKEKMAALARAQLGLTVDAVVANDWSHVTADRSRHPGQLIFSNHAIDFTTLNELSQHLSTFLSGGAQ